MSEDRKREVRVMLGGQCQPHLREVNGDAGGSGRTIEGYAIVFGVESVLLCDWWDGAYREIIEPGAVTADDLAAWDIKMTMFHNREKLLARWNRGEGSLSLSVDEVGVKYSFEAPDTADGNAALELVKRGDLSGSSFTYWSDESHSVRYTKDDEGTLIRHVDRLDMVTEMTVASDPAYQQTNVQAREAVERLRSEEKGKKKSDSFGMVEAVARIGRERELSDL